MGGMGITEEQTEQRITVSFGSHTYWVSRGYDRHKLEQQIVSALRSGGDLVEIPRERARTVSILVSPGADIVIETHQVEPQAEPSFSPHEAHELMWADEFDLGRLDETG